MTTTTPETATTSRATLGLWSGIGVNLGTMIGAGVFVSAGFMAGSMGPGLILLSWLIGGVLAMAGARAYAAVAAVVPRSGGEYRYLSDLLHPWLGYLAGWTSLLAGFSLPIAAGAALAGSFGQTLVPGLDSRITGAIIIIGITMSHALNMRASKWTQDALAIIKTVLIGGFIIAGIVAGKHAWPTWTPPAPTVGLGATVSVFMGQMVYVMYGYSGWNAAVYATEDFKDPKTTVPRSMVIAAAVVMVIYLLVNWVLVANLTPDIVHTFLGGNPDQVTLGHLVTRSLLGDIGGDVMSGLIIFLLISAVSSMTMVGPRVYESMALDGFFPKAFIGKEGKPPLFSVLLQGALALAVVLVQTLENTIKNVTVLLTLTSMLTVATLFKVQFDKRHLSKPGFVPLAAATLFIGMSGWMLWALLGVRTWQWLLEIPSELFWIGAVVFAATAGYFATKAFGGKAVSE